MLAKLYPTLNPSINEMFFCRVLILVEGIEDVAHLSSYISLLGLMPRFRKCGCHIVPVGGKSELIKPAAMAKQLDIPVYVLADADTNVTKEDHIRMHKADNRSILNVMGYEAESDWPGDHIWKKDLVMWKNCLTSLVVEEIGSAWEKHVTAADAFYGNPGGLKKNPLAISRAHELAWKAGDKSASLERLANEIMSFAESGASASNRA
ncbi:MAG: ATP-dependent endonuclease [Pseudomonadota bacterium]